MFAYEGYKIKWNRDGLRSSREKTPFKLFLSEKLKNKIK